jgi:oxalate decarboxylase
MNRRQLLQGAPFAAAAAQASAAPAPQPKVEPIANFKFDIEDQRGWVGPAGTAKEATVEEFPVSQSIAGVSMRLKPGAMRELHWHSLAAEWAYVLEGRMRATIVMPNGQSEIAEFVPGDTWYFPRGHGHALQAMDNDCHFLLGFDNGHFSEFGTFSVTDWIANTPPDILSRNLGLPASAFAQFPKKEAYICAGKVPTSSVEALRDGTLQPPQFSHKYRLDMQTPRVFPGGREYLVSSKEFPIQTSLTAVRMDLQPGALREMHWHPNADEWQYYIAGQARMTVFEGSSKARTIDFHPGDVGYIQKALPHYIENTGDTDLEFLELFRSDKYQDISLTQWISHLPPELVQAHLRIAANVIQSLPKEKQVIVPA